MKRWLSILSAVLLAWLQVAAFNEKAADVDGEGEVTIFDAAAIQRWLAGISAPEGINKPIR